MPHRFLRQETGKWEEVEREKWCWEAHYVDGWVLKQFGNDGVFHQFREIDQTRLASFKMVSSSGPGVFTLLFVPGRMKLIHFYRNIVLNFATELEQRIKLYCFGYEAKIAGRNHKVLMVILPNNELVLTDNVDNIQVV